MKRSTINVFLVVTIISLVCEKIGKVQLGKVALFPMLFAVIIGMMLTPDLLGKKIQKLRDIIGEKEMKIACDMVMLILLMLGIKLGTFVGPNIEKIIQAGPAFLAQELGHILAPIIAVPLALKLGLKRETIGAGSSISREASLGVIGEKYGISSPEGSGVLGVYLAGTIVGTIYFGILGSISIYSGLHPLALGMACGVGSGSMMTAAASSLAEVVGPQYAEQVFAYASTSNMLSGLTGVNILVFISLPFTEWYYKKLEPKFLKKEVEKYA
ncbi:DUF3100 domain-containing protein [uncultured Cetobacterium sp.]|uniref:DUF3100 domain-containing protein n=1 Tax=uncultured Cetobacterium sp. TaxID=527638 RepID=UPI0026112AC8|nr:DUF3100 domain-containing protein [uncultured Cetobacterium sp.]